jgi:formate dehydrogenase subunit delta
MNVEKLIRMANQIASNFDPGHEDKAVAGVLEHLSMYWTVDMKRAIVEYRQAGGSGLNAVATAAVAGLAEKYGATA